MKTINLFVILVVSFLLKIPVYFLTLIESISRSGIHNFEDFLKLFSSGSNLFQFVIVVGVNIIIIYYTIKLKTLIIKKILQVPIVIKVIKLVRDTLLFLIIAITPKAYK